VNVRFFEGSLLTRYYCPKSIATIGTQKVINGQPNDSNFIFADSEIKKGVITFPKPGGLLFTGTRFVFKTKEKLLKIMERKLVLSFSSSIIQYSRMKEEEEIQNIKLEINTEKAVKKRIEEIRNLKDGWYEGEKKI